MNYFTNLSDEELLLQYTIDKRQFDRDHPLNRAPLNVGCPSPAQCLIIGKWYYENGRLFEYNKPLDWLFKADRLGEREAAHYIGRIYFDTGSDAQCEYAHQWFKKSALANNPESEYYLGEMYSEGKGVDKDMSTALVWYTKAAQRGHLQAQVKAGLIYAATPNHRESVIKAHHWLSSAAEANNLDAIRALSKLKKNTNYHLPDLMRNEHPYPQIKKKVETPPEITNAFIQNDKIGINVMPSLGQNADNAPQELVQTAIESLHIKDNADNQPSPYTQNNSLDDESAITPTLKSNDTMDVTMNDITPLESGNDKRKLNKVDWTSTKRRSLSEERALQYDFDEMKGRSENKSVMDVDAESSRNTKSPMALVDQSKKKGPIQGRRATQILKRLREQDSERNETIKTITKKLNVLRKKIRKIRKAKEEGKILEQRSKDLEKLFYAIAANGVD